ncbi:HNH endonuclease signature motif containing protein [Micromonospora globispora]|uniref:HNH endonuclease signature motif containing protein n=1 Tax=Micromonospora globispora TaxID=1450148 RepID=UPI001C8A89CB|nr:HNH endonuclease signature motif containing protein [Micromonospora globispora]
MVRYRYSPERLAEAAAQARSVTEVMRLLGVRISGGSHAHISRQLKRFGIDTSHFTGQLYSRGRIGRRRPSTEVLVKLAPDARRTPGFRLKRALAFIGLPEQCEICGVGTTWQGRPLVLHVDHINGDFLDNRPPNLRLLCPNCHSQTATYAGRRNRRPAGEDALRHTQDDPPDDPASRLAQAGGSTSPLEEQEVVALVRQVAAGELTAVAAGRRMNCSRDRVRRMRRRLEATGTVRPQPRPGDAPYGGSSAMPLCALLSPTLTGVHGRLPSAWPTHWTKTGQSATAPCISS